MTVLVIIAWMTRDALLRNSTDPFRIVLPYVLLAAAGMVVLMAVRSALGGFRTTSTHWMCSKTRCRLEVIMTLLSMNARSREFLHSMRPLLFGIPTFLIVSVFLVWSLAKLASWVFLAIKATK